MSELLTHSMLIHHTQVKQVLMCLTSLRSSRSQEAWRHSTLKLGKPVASYLSPNSILLKKKKTPRDQLLPLKQVRNSLIRFPLYHEHPWNTCAYTTGTDIPHHIHGLSPTSPMTLLEKVYQIQTRLTGPYGSITLLWCTGFYRKATLRKLIDNNIPIMYI